ncbi:unannotated protein [freshwater metagenome]|uniref:shikimate kinase n=1 Tax=freshwater metagenome TaxID=449393 RepID=A0A6J6SRX6_9ZZZZ
MTALFDSHICLVGLSGSGKSTLGPLLASQLNLGACVDLDLVVEQRLGAPASQIFAEQGEPLFRQYECEALAEALAGPAVVIAAGGGIVLDPTNRMMLKAQATVIWLRASVPDLVERLRDSEASRPLLTGDVEFALHRLAEERTALYASVADVVIDVDGLDPRTLTEAVVEELR